MQDLTLQESDKKNYICSVYPSDIDSKIFIVNFANGTVSQGIKNYEEYMKQMEKQFYTYKDEFIKVNNNKYCLLKIAKELTNFLLVIEGIIFFYNFDNITLIKIILLIGIILVTLFYISICQNKMKKIIDKIGNIMATQYYLENKEEFVAIAYSEDLVYKYSIVDMNNISNFLSKKELLEYKKANNKPIKLLKK